VGGTLHATCHSYFGVKRDTALANAEQCVDDKHDIENIEGHLRCVISSRKVSGGGVHPYTADVVSTLGEVKKITVPCLVNVVNCAPGEEIITMRIDQPRVDVPQTRYDNIRFQPGDAVTLNAGGCVQPGGAGLSWKSYVHSAGTNGEYTGTIAIAGDTPEHTVAYIVKGGPQALAGLLNQIITVPIQTDPALKGDIALQLGYSDPGNYQDNGYYTHDDGVNNQCKDIGPAWVEVTIVRQLSYVPTGVAWSPHSKPFDLVWDVNDEDYNGLPLNPQWAYQLTHPWGVPDFPSICGNAFSNGNTVNADTLALNCTSQPTILDVSHSSLVGDSTPWGEFCTGLIDGHLNWMIATYTGTFGWQDWSGDPGLLNAYLNDGDYNLGLTNFQIVNGYNDFRGMTTNESTIGVEFNDDETVNRATAPWWQQLRAGAGDDSTPYTVPQKMFNQVYGLGLQGVVTGLVSIDGVHGGYAESHPAFAVALSPSETGVNGGLQQQWVFFLRNSGTGGNCSEGSYFWPGLGPQGNVYYIQLPWPGGATDVKLVAGNFWAWQNAGGQAAVMRSPEPGWTLIKVTLPTGVVEPGMDGEFTLQYTFPGDQVVVRKKDTAPPASKKTESEDKYSSDMFTSRIADPAAKAKFTADLQQALGSLSTRPPVVRVPITVSNEIEVEPRTAGPASRGESTAFRMDPDPTAQKRKEAFDKLLGTYRPQMQAAPPAPK
jgi:hypothetical protein